MSVFINVIIGNIEGQGKENMSEKGKIGQLNGVNKELCYLLRPKPRETDKHII